MLRRIYLRLRQEIATYRLVLRDRRTPKSAKWLLEVFNVLELKKTVRVANDGTITLPLVGNLKAAGLTAQQLRQELETQYSKTYLENPQISVFILEFHAQPVSVIGAVEKPGFYQLTGPRNLMEVLSMAEGLGKAITLVFKEITASFCTFPPCC